MDPNHDADIRIGSEAPKQRLPNLSFGMRAMVTREQTATSDRSWQIVAFKRLSPKLGFRFLPIECPFLLVAYAADLNWKPSGTKPVFT